MDLGDFLSTAANQHLPGAGFSLPTVLISRLSTGLQAARAWARPRTTAPVVLAAHLPVLHEETSLRRAIVLFSFPLPMFFQVFCRREKSEFHWKVGSCNVWLGVRRAPQADLPPREGWQLTHGAGSASHTLLCAVPAGAETAAGIPLKTNPLVCPCCNQIRVDMEGKKKKKKKMEIREGGYRGGFFCTVCCEVLSCRSAKLSGEPCSVVFPFCSLFVQYCGLSAQQHSAAEVFQAQKSLVPLWQQDDVPSVGTTPKGSSNYLRHFPLKHLFHLEDL